MSKQSVDKYRRLLLLTPLLFCFSACSGSLTNKILPNRGTPESRATVSSLAVEYLTYIVIGRHDRLVELVALDIYLDGKGKGYGRNEYLKQLNAVKNHWKKNDPEHPLLNLEIVDVSIRNNDAEVILKKMGNSNNPPIKIKFGWSGIAWLIEDDSLFGPKGFFSNLASTS